MKDPNAILDDRKLNLKIGRWFTEQRSTRKVKEEISKPLTGKEPGTETETEKANGNETE